MSRGVICEISGFRCGVVQTFALLGRYAAQFGSWLRRFGVELPVPSSRFDRLLFVFFWVISRSLNFICRRFGTLCSFFIGRQLPAYEDGTECSETSAYKIHTPGNYPEENIQHTEDGASLKSRIRRTALPLKMEPTGCPEATVNNYRPTPRNIPGQRSPVGWLQSVCVTVLPVRMYVLTL